MKTMRHGNRSRGIARKAACSLVLGVSVGALGACDSLLEVELPHILTDAAIQDVTSAQIQVNSVQALFECGMSSMSWIALGHEDVFESVAGVAGGAHVYLGSGPTGSCDGSQSSGAWFDQIMGTRQMVSTNPARLGNYGGSSEVKGVYDRLVDDGWIAQLPGVGERLAAISAIYMGASLSHFGQFYCEGALDQGKLITGPQFLALAERWLTVEALPHIGLAGTFAMPNGSTTGTGASPTNTVIALRAQVRLAAGDLAGANADAVTVLGSSPAFTFNATRESGSQRRNKVYDSGTAAAFSGMLGINTYWNGATRNTNPATGALWPATIPFTGYIFLGIQPDGRTLEATNTPVRWAQEIRSPATASPAEAAVSLNNGSVQDPRITHLYKSIQGPAKREVPTKFSAVENDIPLVTWRELTLIRARFENEVSNNQGAAIALINNMRPGAAACTPVSAACVPNISGALNTALTNGTDDASISGANDQAEMRVVILEEARREFYSESGRWWQWKIQNTDLMWFPRFQGFTSAGVYRLQGGVRLAFPTDEYERNVNFQPLNIALRGSGCVAALASQAADVSERPVF
ncbi:MAG: RagB/SusD family nutrient uptake outer membrane protein [Gemmatimonadetes bacterium]|nr:RagB/SusD family nutrient uptake outer membrane protein [Gemmatimonadota bacterium]